uniref:Lysophosphatidylserine lipase ABHD12 n=1 Tax=Parastrongyloides trichosuri TaxID=131310 RepID=A0A0N5A1Y5_PARTI
MISDFLNTNIKYFTINNIQNLGRKLATAVVISVILIYPAFPLVCYFSPKTAQKIIFGNTSLKSTDLSNLKKQGIKGKGRSFYLSDQNGQRFGLYHILPMNSMVQFGNINENDKKFEEALKSLRDPIIIYCHGIIGDRAREHRVCMNNNMSQWNYHVISLDYFGFGDSDGSASEESCVNSIVLTAEYLNKLIGNNFFVWGHSFGTCVLLNALGVLKKKKIVPLGCILESPFNNLYDTMKWDWRYIIYSWIPMIDNILFDPIVRSGLIANSSKYIENVACPIQIFHSADDLVVPKELCLDLYQHGKKANRDIDIKFFDEELQLGHESIHKASNLAELVAKFESKCLKKRIMQK